MTKKEAKERTENLKKVIRHHHYLYHVLDKPEISDSAFDSLKNELFQLEKEFPEFVTPDSPTQKVGGKPQDQFEKVKHSEPMLSINDAFEKEDVADWLERNIKLLTSKEASQLDFFCELKIDGLAIELIYRDSVLTTAATRGNGEVGEKVTQNIRTIASLPLRLREMGRETGDPISRGDRISSNRTVVVRGEAFISKKEFDKLNKERKKAGEVLYANPRNVAAGSIRQLDPKVTASRHLDFFAYDLVSDFGAKTHEEKHKILKALGFKTIPENKFCKDLKAVFDFHEKWQKEREKLPFEIDGIVIIVNQNNIFEKLGVVGKAPRGMLAFKFSLKQAATKVKDIKVQVGRIGTLTPIAILEPVQIGGVTVSRATLHNQDEIERLGVKIGDTVIVGRAGDVIPDIIKVLPGLRTGKEKDFKMPKVCPICDSKIVRPEGEVNFYCQNPECRARQRRNLYHFVSRSAFNIEGLGPKIIDKLLDAGLISDAADLFMLGKGDLLPLESLPRRPRPFSEKGGVLRGFAEKSAQNLIESIQKSKEVSLPRFIYALGIKNVGEETAFDLARYFGTLEGLKDASAEELENILDIGPIVSRSIKDWFSQERNLKFLEKLKKVGIKILEEKKAGRSVLAGKKFVLTGNLETLTRDEAEEKIRALGGEVSNSVSKNTDFLVVGKSPGLKYEKAKKLGTKIINEQEFLRMFNLGD